MYCVLSVVNEFLFVTAHDDVNNSEEYNDLFIVYASIIQTWVDTISSISCSFEIFGESIVLIVSTLLKPV